MAQRPEAFDVHFVAADTVYKGVPYGVLTGWAGQGRLSANDAVRPAGTDGPWVRCGDHPLVADFLFRPAGLAPAPPVPAATEPTDSLDAVELDPPPRPKLDDDDDVDMIPLIDVSLVLVLFYIMKMTVGAAPEVNVPEMQRAAELRTDEVPAVTVQIDKRQDGAVVYAVQVGTAAPAAENSNLPDLPAVVARLEALLPPANVDSKKLPEVRIACHRELPRRHVRDLSKELEKLKVANRLAYYGAEVKGKPE